ncbi:MAG: hypothetical protein HFACDABA_00493 [Anaerolineales bacterium]|nr:hypothetical protein [Anaerolineales bacterium]
MCIPDSTRSQILAGLRVFLIFFAAMTWLEFSTPHLPDNDGYYHIKMAYLMRSEGLKPAFPYLPLTILSADEFYDHHFLYHVALIPFTFGDLRLGAKWSAVLFASLAFLAVWILFKRQRVPLHWLWAFGLLALSAPFLYRMCVTRTQSLSLGMLVLGMLFLLEGKNKSLAALAFVYVWMYDAFPILLALGVLHFIAVALIERRFDFRPMLYIAGGILAGALVNPFFPDNIVFTYHHLFAKLTDATSTGVGNEWYPYTTLHILDNSFLSLAIFAGGIFALGLAGRKMDTRTAFGLLAALMFGWMFFQARRFVEYYPPFALIFTAFAFTPLLDRQADSPSPADSRLTRFLPGFPSILLALVLAAGMFRTLPLARSDMLETAPYWDFRGASIWLEHNTPAGSRVFQTDWDDFPRLFFYNTHNTYTVGLDPTYMQIRDPGLYDAWVRLVNGDTQPISSPIVHTFGARYIVSDLRHAAFLEAAKTDPYLVEVYRDESAVVYEITLP